MDIGLTGIIILAIIILSFYIYYKYNYYIKMKKVKSTVDNRYYEVQNKERISPRTDPK